LLFNLLPLLEKEYSNYIIENVYYSIREIAESINLKKGIKTENHIETIKLLEGSLTKKQTLFLDEIRQVRNKIKYEGKKQNMEYAKKTLEFLKEIYPILTEIINKN